MDDKLCEQLNIWPHILSSLFSNTMVEEENSPRGSQILAGSIVW